MIQMYADDLLIEASSWFLIHTYGYYSYYGYYTEVVRGYSSALLLSLPLVTPLLSS